MIAWLAVCASRAADPEASDHHSTLLKINTEVKNPNAIVIMDAATGESAKPNEVDVAKCSHMHSFQVTRKLV